MRGAIRMVAHDRMAKAVSEIDPLSDERWSEFLQRHELATVFHSREWLDALRRTYGYSAGAVTTCGSDEILTDGLVFCRVRSWLTGRRIVSVPFSDHCTPLVDTAEQLGWLLANLKDGLDLERGEYVEIRPSTPIVAPDLVECVSYCHHRLDLRPALNVIYRGFHNDCVRRKIRRAERTGLIYQEGRSESLVRRFYQLAVLTRRRQGLVPQPISWFRNLVTCMGDKLTIRLASYDEQPAAAILTIRYKDSMIYKYSCSEARFHKLGSMQLLLWEAIQEAKNDGLREFDMGRSEWGNDGLIHFKDRWGATRSSLRYLRYPGPRLPSPVRRVTIRAAKRIFSRAPDRLLTTVGNLLYRHVA